MAMAMEQARVITPSAYFSSGDSRKVVINVAIVEED